MDTAKLLKQKEGVHLEFKEAALGLPKNLFETVCAFLNHDGGSIVLGVTDSGKPVGIDDSVAGRLITDIVNLSNNPEKLDPPFILSPQKLEYKEKTILVIQVPASSQIHRCDGVVFDRGNSGDFRVREPERIAGMVHTKRNYYTELTICPHLAFSDFDPKVFIKSRRLMSIQAPKHPWLRLSNQQLLNQAGFRRRDPLSGLEGYTLAAGLMFGREQAIERIAPHYRIDALVRRKDIYRYDDRLEIRGNLFNAYDQLMEFTGRHLPDPFYMEGTQRISLRDKIFREVIANLLVHREYTDGSSAQLIIYKDRVETLNPCRPHGSGPIRPGSFTPFSKNPTLSKFFHQIGYSEEIGSGVLNVTHYLSFYAKGRRAKFLEGNPFKIVIPLPVQGQEKSTEKVRRKSGESREELTEKMTEKMTEKIPGQILTLLGEKPAATIADLASVMGVSESTVERHLKKLQKKGNIRRVGPDKGGHWKVSD